MKMCEYCGKKPVKPPRRKYCSRTCSNRANAEKARERDWRRRERSRKKLRPKAGARVCLGCGKEFWSDGPWNRICPRCLAQQRSGSQAYHLSDEDLETAEGDD